MPGTRDLAGTFHLEHLLYGLVTQFEWHPAQLGAAMAELPTASIYANAVAQRSRISRPGAPSPTPQIAM